MVIDLSQLGHGGHRYKERHELSNISTIDKFSFESNSESDQYIYLITHWRLAHQKQLAFPQVMYVCMALVFVELQLG